MSTTIFLIEPQFATIAVQAAERAKGKPSVRAVGDRVQVTVESWAENAVRAALPGHAKVSVRTVREENPVQAVKKARRWFGLP